MKKAIKVSLVLILLIFTMLGLGYLGLAYYYEDGFSFGTYINDVYCTGKSVEEVNTELNAVYDFDGFEIQSLHHSYYIPKENLSYYFNYEEPLNYFIHEQIPLLWIENILHNNRFEIKPEISYDMDFVNTFSQQIFEKENQRDRDVYVISTDKGFRFVNHKENLLDESLALKEIHKALSEGKKSINLRDVGCYYHGELTKDEALLLKFFEDIDHFQNKEIIFQFGKETKKMEVGTIAKMLDCYDFFTEKKLNVSEKDLKKFYKKIKVKDGNFPVLSLNLNSVNTELKEFLHEYQSYKQHEFITYDGRKLIIKGGNYGNLINTSCEIKELIRFLESNEKSFLRVPEYVHKALYQEKNDIGNTYIEVDLGKQKMYYFENGELKIDTDVVTGNNGITPECVCYVYGKQRNRILRGPGYATPVKFWIAVKGGIGIHDASWRKKFGGEIYKGNGSHGCINTPFEEVSLLYETVEIGTPVIMYYGEEIS